jgi:hypothetical protein
MKLVGIANRIVVAVCFVLIVLAVQGCGSGKPKLAEVEGKVTIGGQPLDKAMIYFSPAEGGRTSSGMTDAGGHYVLSFGSDEPGAVLGKHKVTITTYEAPQSDDSGKMIGGIPERVPAKYNKQSTLEKEVTSGAQTIDFQLDAK